MRPMTPPQRKEAEALWRSLQEGLPAEEQDRLTQAQLALEEALETLTNSLERVSFVGNRILALCPFHADKSVGSFMIYKSTGYFVCHSCGARGGLFQLLAKAGLDDHSIRDALKGVDFSTLLSFILGSSREDAHEQILPLPESLLRYYRGEPTLMLERNHPARLLERMEITLDDYRQRIVFPIRWATGQLVAIQSRAVDPAEKRFRWKFYRHEILEDLGNRAVIDFGLQQYTPPRKTVFFNEHHVFEHLKHQVWTRPIVLCEGPGHALRVIECGYPAIASFGTQLADGQRPRLLQALKRLALAQQKAATIILATDGDQPGRMSAFRTALTLGPSFDVRIARIPPGHDPEDLHVKELRPLLQGAETFAQYLEQGGVEREWAAEALDRHAEDIQRYQRRASWKRRQNSVTDWTTTTPKSLNFPYQQSIVQNPQKTPEHADGDYLPFEMDEE